MARYWFISTNRNRSTFALFTVALAFIVIMLGAYTRLTNAGLSCPDWPHCYGYLTAPHTTTQIQDATSRYPLSPVDVKKAWTEMTHRYFAGTEGIFILILSGMLLWGRKFKEQRATSTFIAVCLIALLGTQVALGMLTVTAKLKPVIVLSHLLTGISILSLLWWAYLNSSPQNTATAKGITAWLWLGFFIVIAQITLGGWVSTHYAGLACIDFPYCNGSILPTMHWDQLNTDLITIHMLHRIGALITAVYLSALSIGMIRQKSSRVLGITILMLVTLQISLGILNVIWLRPVWIALAHQTVAILLLLTLITVLSKHYRQGTYA